MSGSPPLLTQKVLLPMTMWGEVKAFVIMGFPLGLGQLLSFFVYAIDAAMIGRLGEFELAASSLGLVMFFVMWMLGSGAVMAVTPLVSQALGANQNARRDVRITLRMSFWIIVFMTPFALLFAVIVEPLCIALGQDPKVSALAADYVLMLMLGWPFALIIFALRNFLAAIEKTWVPLLLIGLTTVSNAALNWVFIYGNLGAPRLELVGAGIASSLSYLISFGLFVAYCYLDPKARKFRVFRRVHIAHWSRFWALIRLGAPMSVMTMFEGMLFNAAVFIVGVIGVAEQAAYQVALNVAAMCFMVPFGLSMAGSVRVGLAAGAGNIEALRRTAKVTILICLGLMALLALCVAFLPAQITSFYLEMDDPANVQVIALIASFLPIAAAFMLFDATQVVANQLLRGVSDVNWPMLITGFSYWIVGFPVAFYLGLHTALGAQGVWYGLMAGLTLAALLLGGRFIYLAYIRPDRLFKAVTSA